MKVDFKITMLTRYKSQLYSMLAWLFPLSILLAYQALTPWLPFAYAVIAIMLSRHFPTYVQGMLAIEDRINLKLGLVTPARICRVFLHVPVVGILYGAIVALSQSSFSAQACLCILPGLPECNPGQSLRPTVDGGIVYRIPYWRSCLCPDR